MKDVINAINTILWKTSLGIYGLFNGEKYRYVL